jgi:4,5-dihydroxyphthalate decarboxylase
MGPCLAEARPARHGAPIRQDVSGRKSQAGLDGAAAYASFLRRRARVPARLRRKPRPAAIRQERKEPICMGEITLTLACTTSDRTRPVLDGHIPVAGCRLVVLPGEPEDIFRRALRDKAFDIAELSMGSHMVTTARGDSAFIGVPVFPSRAFRHSAIYIRTDRGIARPEDLKGRRIGLPDYQQTAGMWVRGILADRHGVGVDSVAWRTGGQEQPGPGERIALDLPPGLDVKPIGPRETLNGLLAAGELDAIVSPRPPSCMTGKTAPVARLFPDFRQAEIEYYKATGMFPIMHCVAIRRDVADAHPWLPIEIYRAFAKAKAQALAELGVINVLRVSLPWIVSSYDETRALMGGSPWRYGFRENLKELEAMTRYAAADGLCRRKVEPAELFHPSTLDAPDM